MKPHDNPPTSLSRPPELNRRPTDYEASNTPSEGTTDTGQTGTCEDPVAQVCHHGATTAQAQLNARPGGPSALHESLLDKYAEGLPRRGFRQAMRELLADIDDAQGRWRMHRALMVLPDAYHVDHEREVVTVVEAIVTNDVGMAKMRRLFELFWLLDEVYWGLELRRIYINGSSDTSDVFRLWADSVRRDAGLPVEPWWTPEDLKRLDEVWS